MSPLALVMRYLLVLAFCLDGSIGLWRASAMAGDLSHHVGDHAASADHHDPIAAAPSDEDCDDEPAAGQGASVHEDCDCRVAGCACACGFAITAVVGSVPFAAQHRLAAAPPARADMGVLQSARSAVFRPPIG